MYTQSQPTLPPITAAIGKGVVDYNSSSLTNGDILHHHIKQEQDFEHSPPSLPPIRTTINDNDNNNNHSRMSINQICNDTESDYEAMKEAAAVLENMKTKAVTTTTTTLPPISNISSQPPQPQPQPQPQPLEPRTNAEPSQLPTSPSAEAGFMSRLGEISIVKKTMNVYESGKDYSPFIKYTTEMVESGVSRFSRPVIEHIDQYTRSLKTNELLDNDNKIEKDDALGLSESDRKRKVMGSENSRSSSPSHRNPSRSHRTSQSSGSSNSSSYAPYTYPNSTVTTSTSSTATRSRWQQMVIGTGAAVGAAGAAVSEESMKSLKYCLQWINYATQHIDAQIAVLKAFIVNLTNPSHRAVVHTSSNSNLASIKKEVIDTLRKVIEVVSKYAGACLPEQAKEKVRSFILNLPSRWASINYTENSSSPSPISSPQLAPANGHPLNQTADYARRLLSLATESLDMLSSVAGIFGDTVGRAEALVEKLKAVGVTSGGANAMGNLHFDNIWSSQANGSSNGYNVYNSSSTSSHSSSGSRSRRSSNSVRMNNHGPRKYSRPTPVHLNDEDDSILNGHDSDSTSDSEVESMRMEMDNSQKRLFKNNVNAKPQQQHANGIIKKRKKGKKENDKMDLS